MGEEDSFDVRALEEGDGGVGRNGIQIPSQGAPGLMLSAFKEMDFTEDRKSVV